MTTHAKAHIGTSGYSYKNWIGDFYPADLDKKDLLSYYADHFDTVEINNSFYNLPEEKTLETWRDKTPSSFRLCLKVSRYITHMKKLNDPQDGVSTFLDAIQPIADKKGPVLLQLPPHLGPDYEALDKTLAAFRDLDDEFRWKVAVECRNEDWYGEELDDVIGGHNATLVIHDKPEGKNDRPVPDSPFLYMRFHGPDGDYRGQYDGRHLRAVADRISGWCNKGKTFYAFFNNDANGYAPHDALKLKEMIA